MGFRNGALYHMDRNDGSHVGWNPELQATHTVSQPKITTTHLGLGSRFGLEASSEIEMPILKPTEIPDNHSAEIHFTANQSGMDDKHHSLCWKS
jgi:hypothetical protein